MTPVCINEDFIAVFPVTCFGGRRGWQEVNGEAISVNAADYSCVIWCTAGLEERQRRCGVGVVVRRWSCPAHTGNEVSSWWVVCKWL